MKSPKHWIIAAMAAVLTLSIIAGASAQGGPPSPPAFFEGTVTAPEGPVPAGLAVVAEIEGKNCNTNSAATAETFIRDGETRYWSIVDHASINTGCGFTGAAIRFKVGERYAATPGTWATFPVRHKLNLTLEPLPPPEPETVTINVTVWRSVRTDRTYISTQPPGASWTTHGTPIDLSMLHEDGNFYEGSPIPVEVNLGGDRSVTINVTVWRSVRTDRTYISTQPPGASWTTHGTPIDLSTLHEDGNFYEGSPIPIEVDLE